MLNNLIKRGPDDRRPLRVLIHSEPKAGKTHLAAGAPHALFLDAEQGTLGFDIDRVEVRDYNAVAQVLDGLEREQHDYKTLVIDTLDALERHLGTMVAQQNRADSLAEIPFGRGWSAVEAEWHALTERLATLQQRRGMSIVILAHCAPATIETPAGESWAEWRLRTHKKTQQLWLGWVEDVLFLHQEVKTKRKSKIAESSRRVLETREAAAWQAGSRRIQQPQIVLPNSPDPAACWAVLRNAYKAGMRSASAQPPAPAPAADHTKSNGGAAPSQQSGPPEPPEDEGTGQAAAGGDRPVSDGGSNPPASTINDPIGGKKWGDMTWRQAGDLHSIDLVDWVMRHKPDEAERCRNALGASGRPMAKAAIERLDKKLAMRARNAPGAWLEEEGGDELAARLEQELASRTDDELQALCAEHGVEDLPDLACALTRNQVDDLLAVTA